MTLAKRILAKHGLDYTGEFIVGMRDMHHILDMLYDRTDPAMTKAAYQCFDELVTEFSAQGYGSYCTNTAFMDKVADTYGPVQRSINHNEKTTVRRIDIHSPALYFSITSGTDSVVYMKGVVMQFRQSIIPTVSLLVMSMGLFCGAEAKTIEAGHATVSWKGKGVIDDVGNGYRVFSGTVTGTLLVKHLPEGSAPAQIHAGKLDCQAIFRISENNEERHTALCLMRAHEGKDLAYGEIRCIGKKDECKGEFTFVWGSGGLKGITGTTPYVGGIIIENQKEGQIYGSAHWPEMTYTLP